MERWQRSRGLGYRDEHFRFFLCTRAPLDSLRGASLAMEATLLSSHHFNPRFFSPKPFKISGLIICLASEKRRNFFFFFCLVILLLLLIFVFIDQTKLPLYSVPSQSFALLCFFLNPKIQNSFAFLGSQTG